MKHRVLTLPIFFVLPATLAGAVASEAVAAEQTTSAQSGASNTCALSSVTHSDTTQIFVQLDGAPPVQLAFWSSPQQMAVNITGIIEQLNCPMEMKVSPQAINVNPNSDVPHVQMKIMVPDIARNSRLDFKSIKINGVPVELETKTESDPKIGPKYVHLFFDRAKIASILGPDEGEKIVTLQMSFGGGHLLTASDTVKLLVKGKS